MVIYGGDSLSEDINKGKAWRGIIRKICFAAFGVSAFSNPLDRFNVFNIIFGILIGLLFGWLFKKFLRGFLGLFNARFKKEHGKEVIRYAVDSGMLFLIPFAVMVLMAVFCLHWSMTGGFISAGIMAVGTAAAITMGKLKGRHEFRNTLATSGVSLLFSFIWTFSYPYMLKAPPLIEGGVTIIRSIVLGGGTGL